MGVNRPPSVVHVHVECRPLRPHFDARLGRLGPLVPRAVANRFIHRNFLPNNLLRALARRGRIALRTHVLAFRDRYGAADAGAVPPADVWLFSLQNWQHAPAFAPDFFAALADRAARHGVRMVNACSHVDDGPAPGAAEVGYPCIAKLRGNGMVSPDDPGSYAILAGPGDEAAWRQAAASPQDFAVHPWLADRRSDPAGGRHVVERWIVIGDDLTVGTRVSREPIVKQTNSVTSYRRDAAAPGAGDEYDLLRGLLDGGLGSAGSLPLSFQYHDDPAFWDRRRDMLRGLRDRTGFCLGSVDAVETAADGPVIIDWNEHTFEAAHPDLAAIWAERLFRLIAAR